jgi:hypothetical protein
MGRLRIALVLLAQVACAGIRATPEPATSTASCGVSVGIADTAPWREVTLPGYLLCLPADWHRYSAPYAAEASLAGGWVGPTDTLNWALGPFGYSPNSGMPEWTSWRRSNETINGLAVAFDVTLVEQDQYRVQAGFQGLLLAGRTEKRGNPDLLVAIVHTVRPRSP